MTASLAADPPPPGVWDQNVPTAKSVDRSILVFLRALPRFKTDFWRDPHPMKREGTPKPPRHLRAETRKWFLDVTKAYELEEHHCRLLALAGEAWDRGQQAREALAEHGLTYVDRFGCPRARPEAAIERDSRTGFARLLRELDLDVEAPAESPRPPAIRSNRR